MKVYCIENTINSKKYIGITKRKIENRLKQHILKSKTLQKQHLHDALNLYGVGFFKIYELDVANSISELYEKEKYWIQKLDTKNTGYNETDGGEGSHGRVLSEETKQKIREKAKIRFSDSENRKKLSESTKIGMKNWWNTLVDIEKEKWINSCKKKPVGYKKIGCKHTEETKKKMSESHKGKTFTDAHRQSMKETWIRRKQRKEGLVDAD